MINIHSFINCFSYLLTDMVVLQYFAQMVINILATITVHYLDDYYITLIVLILLIFFSKIYIYKLQDRQKD